MKHTGAPFSSSYSGLGNFRPTTVLPGLSPITGPRFLRQHPEVRALPFTGIARLPRYYDPLRAPAGPLSLLRTLESSSARTGSPPLAQTTLPACRAHYPGGPKPVRVSVASRSARPSRSSGGSASTITLSRPARASLALRPAGSLSHPRWPLSQGSDPARYRSEPLVSYQTYRQRSGWDFHPPVICAVGAHRRISAFVLCGRGKY